MKTPSPASETLSSLADRYWAHLLATEPTTALLLGHPEHLTEMEDMSREGEEANQRELRAFAAAARTIDPNGLTPAEQVTREVLLFETESAAAELESRRAEFAVDPVLGAQVTLLQLVGQIVLTEVDQAAGLLEKWSKVGGLFDQLIARLQEGAAAGRTPPRISVEKVIAQVDRYLATEAGTDPFAAVGPPPGLPQAEVEVWRRQLIGVVTDVIRPGYQRYAEVLRHEVLPVARPPERSGLFALPDGEEVYRRAVAKFTTLSVSPAELHETGLSIIEELSDEYRALAGSVLAESDLAKIYDQLRTDPSLRFLTPGEIVQTARAAMDRAQTALPGFFGRLPRATCVMAEIPGPSAKDSTLAFYLPPASDGSRPGTFFINTTEPQTRTRYEAEALAFHESIPGHHLQIAIAQELEGVPEFQKNTVITAYVEGWGLYTERLSDEMGLYSNDLARFGMLSFDSWRAGRLVVDTGIHAFGWSRQQAIDWMRDNSPQAPNNIENEIDRYIGWPGQALAYMTGRREIVRLRGEAERRLGQTFDLRRFHDLVLSSGPVPLPTLGRMVGDWTG